MTRQQIEERIEDLEDRRFILDMKDRWNSDDYRTDREWSEEIRTLKKQLETM